jgi:acyl-CoA synthetase (NDP forming)
LIVKLQFRLAEGSEWEVSNPVLDEAEPGYDTTLKAFKVGDGSTAWNDLAYQSADPTLLTEALEGSVAAQAAAEAAQAAAAQSASDAAQAAQAATVLPRYSTEERPDPTAIAGQMVYDTTLGLTLVSNGTEWEDMTGTPVV